MRRDARSYLSGRYRRSTTHSLVQGGQRRNSNMGQALSCCVFCCPCLWQHKSRASAAVAVPEEADDSKSKLLPSSSSEARKGNVRSKKTAKHKRPPSHLRGLPGDINQVVRLVLVGSCDTGKTCLLRRFLGGYFDVAGQQDYTRTLGVDFGCKTVELADRGVRLQMWDTGGSETYRSVVSHYLRGADGVILCFDVNHRTTLRALRSTWAPFLDKHTPRTCRVLLAGNKADSRGNSRTDGAEVLPEDAQRFANAIEAQVFETSAKLGTNVDSAVLALMREVLHHRQFAAQEKAPSDEKGASPTRKGRKRLSAALRDVMEGGSDGDAASYDSARGGEVGRPSRTHEPQDAVAQGPSYASSSSASQVDGDGSYQSSNSGNSRGIQGQMWAPFPSTDDGAGDSSVQRGGTGIDCRRSTTGGIGSGSAMASGRGKTGRGSRGPNDGSDVVRRGRYHFFNQLVIAAPSRAKSMDSAKRNSEGGGCGGGGKSSQRISRSDSRVRSRTQNVDVGSPGTLFRGERTSSRKHVIHHTVQSPGLTVSAAISATSAMPQRPCTAPSIEPLSLAVGEQPATMNVDDRQRLEGGGRTRPCVGAFSTATGAERMEGSTSPGACDAPLSRLPDNARLSVNSQETTEDKYSPQQVQRQHQRSVVCDGKGIGGVDVDCGGGRFDRTLATSSASSSCSTVVIGDDPVGYRDTFPIQEEV